MKKYVLLSFAAFLAVITLSSYEQGISNYKDCTGGTGSATSCGTSASGCHSSSVSSNLVLSIILTDDKGVIVSDGKYIPEKYYRVTLRGMLSSGSSYPYFGFQFTTAKVNDGQFTLLNNYQKWLVVNQSYFIEHSTPIPAQNNGTKFETDFFWQAPPAGAGTITFYCTMLAADGNGFASNDIDRNTYSSFMETLPTAVTDLSKDAAISTYPNPAKDNINLSINTKQFGEYGITVFNLSGQKIYSNKINITREDCVTNIATTDWNTGMYFLEVRKGDAVKQIKVMKN